MYELKFTTAGDYMKKTKTFRSWLNQRWVEHKDEVFNTTGKTCDYDLKDYFHKHKWWLRRIYKEEMNNGN